MPGTERGQRRAMLGIAAVFFAIVATRAAVSASSRNVARAARQLVGTRSGWAGKFQRLWRNDHAFFHDRAPNS